MKAFYFRRKCPAAEGTGGGDAVRIAARWLGLAAAPTFALMALLTAALDGGPMAITCAGGSDSWALGGMAPMYLLMSAFHLSPWLRLVAGRVRRPPFGQPGTG